jgi:ABC-type nitrate/sulfonate/bicarbonate transport system substrate-binding protein
MTNWYEADPGPLTRRALLSRALRAAVVTPPLLGMLAAGCQPSTPAPASSPAPSGKPASPAGTAANAPLVLSPRQPLKLAWTALTGSQAAYWMAYETGAWQELGLDVELLRIPSSSRLASSMVAGEVDGGTLDYAVAFQIAAQGGDTRIVGGITNRQIFAVVARPDITRPQDVVGKRWGITRLGSSTHTASLLALEMWNLRASDVQFIQLQEVPAILAGIEAEQIDVGAVSPPTSTRAVQAGLRELIDLATDGPEYPSIGLSILQRHVDQNPAVARAYIAGYAAGVARFRSDREQALQVMQKYIQIDDQAILADTHARASNYLAFPPLVPMASLPRVKADVAVEDPQVANVAITDVAVPTFAEELAAQGYFARLG